jgi:transcriptional regulator with XRE-family HTH domain
MGQPRLVVRALALRMEKSQQRGGILSIKEAAEGMGISPSALGQIERGKKWPTRETLEKICCFYQVTDMNQILEMRSDDQEGAEEDVSG